MTTLTIAAAARLCGCHRRTLQRAIHAGRLQLDAEHRLSREALIAAGYLIVETPQEAPHQTPLRAPQGSPHHTPLRKPHPMPQAVPHVTPQDTPHGTPHIYLTRSEIELF
jgi:hypothetical protein